MSKKSHVLASLSLCFSLGSQSFAAPINSDLSREERSAITVDQLMTKSQAELDLLYKQLPTGAHPDGEYKGYVIFDGSEDNQIEHLLGIVSPLGILESIVKKAGVRIWKGKVFNKEEKILRNRILLHLQYPAHVGCGTSLFDEAKPSIVLDYNGGSTIKGYNPLIDWQMDSKGLGIRDEIRMVRPGLYLGRAYLRGTFALNFVIEKEDEQGKPELWQNLCESVPAKTTH